MHLLSPSHISLSSFLSSPFYLPPFLKLPVKYPIGGFNVMGPTPEVGRSISGISNVIDAPKLQKKKNP
jgi:hypothetical protein